MSYPNHIDGECIALERYALTVLIHSSKITDRVWRVQKPLVLEQQLQFCFSVLNKMFDCLRKAWCLKKDEMNEGDIPPITDAKGGTGAHSRHSWPTGYQLDCSEFKKPCTVESTGSPNCSCGENWWGKVDVLKYLSYISYLLPVHQPFWNMQTQIFEDT